jgi:hypothetical protein
LVIPSSQDSRVMDVQPGMDKQVHICVLEKAE